MDAYGEEVVRKLLTRLDLPQEAFERNLRFTGQDPVVPSRYRVGLASASALAAQAVGVMEIWKQRGGRDQTATIDFRRAAVPGLRTISHTKRGGRLLQVPWPAHEKQVFFPTKDGRLIYLMRHGVYYEHLGKLLGFLGASPDSASIAAQVIKWNAAELEDALAERRLMGTIVRTYEEWLASPQGRHLEGRLPIEIEKLGDSAPMPFQPGPRPLSGVRIVDMAHVLAGPVTSKVLAEQGAEVVHVSAPHQQDPVHVMIDTGFGKRSAYAHLDRKEDVETLLRLVEGADIFAHSWRPGSLDRRGLSPQALASRRPGLIYVSVSCYGYDGPWAERAGYDPLGQVASGLAAGEGDVTAPLMASTFTLNDYLAAYLAAAGANAALLRRAREGGSYHVKVSLTGASLYVQQLGRLDPRYWADGKDGVATLPAPMPEELTTTRTPYGLIEHPLPIIQYSATPSYWELPPEPAGASEAVWRAA
jgi:crotonobetainyl-CoA:carnitine CoA-transferase CaiB-like acyl-CoA transferase